MKRIIQGVYPCLLLSIAVAASSLRVSQETCCVFPGIVALITSLMFVLYLQLNQPTTRSLEIDYEVESLLALRWRLQQSSVNYDGLRFDINYTVSDFITESLVEYIIYDGVECSFGANDVTDSGYFDSWVTTEVGVPGSGLTTQELTFSSNILPETITQSTAYEETGNEASINFCVKLSLYNKALPDPTAVVIKSQEAVIKLDIDLVDNLSISGQDVTPRDVGVETSDDAFYVEAFVCEEDGTPPEDTQPLLQGQGILVCVKPTQQALDIGFRVRRIDSFTFIQGSLTQAAVVDQVSSVNGLTELWCDAGASLCMFETILQADFYFGAAANVGGSGLATLQFGSGGFRRLDIRERNLQSSKAIALDLFGVERIDFDFQRSGATNQLSCCVALAIALSSLSVMLWL
jgi:hypothetical protein